MAILSAAQQRRLNRQNHQWRKLDVAGRIQFLDTDGTFLGTSAVGVALIADSGGISANDIVYVSGYDSTTGYPKVLPADADTVAKARDLYWCPNAITATETGYGYKGGTFTSGLSGTIGDPVYLSDGTAGEVTLSEPTGTDTVVEVGTLATTGASGVVHIDLGAGERILIHDHLDDAGGGGLAVTGTINQTFTVDSDTTNTKMILSAAASGTSGNTLTLIAAATMAGSRVITFADPGGAATVCYDTGTNQTSFEVDLDGTVPAMALGVGTSGDFTMVLKPSSTLSAGVDVTFQDGAGTVAYTSFKQSLTCLGSSNGGIVVSPVASGTNNFTIQNQALSTAMTMTLPSYTAGTYFFAKTTNSDGTLASTGATGTTNISFETYAGTAEPSLAISGSSGGTGDFTTTLMAATTVTANRTIRVPDAADTMALLNASQILAAKTLSNPSFTGGAITLSAAVTVAGTWTDIGIISTADINGGTLDGTAIGGSVTAAGAFTTLASSSAATLASLVCTAGATFGGGKGATGTSISTAGVIGTDGVTTVHLDDTDDGVSDPLILIHSSSDDDATVADGVGIAFHLQNDQNSPGGVEEWGSFEMVSTGITNGSEDGDFVFRQMLNGVVGETMRLDASAQEVVIGQSAAEADNFNALRIYCHTTAARGSLRLVSAINGTGDFTTTVTQATDVSESQVITIPDSDASTDTFDLIGSAQSISAVKTFTAPPIIDYDQATSNDVQTTLTIKRTVSGGNAATGVGQLHSFWLENDAGTEEEHASFQVVTTDAGDGTEDTDLVWSTMTAGTVAEVLRVVAASSATVADKLVLTANTTEDNAIVEILRLKGNVGTGAANFGAGISVWLTNDNSDKEEHSSIQFQTDAAVGAEDTDIIFNTMLDGTVTEAMRLDASDNSLTLGADTSKIVQLRIHPATTNSGTFILKATDNTGDTDFTLTNVAQGGANTAQVPDLGAGVTDQFVMEDVAQTLTLKELTSPLIGTRLDLGAAAAAASSSSRVVIRKDAMADGVATAVITFTVPNAAHAAACKVTCLAMIADQESARCAEGLVILSRVSGSAVVGAVAALDLAQIATGGAETLTLAYGLSAAVGAVGATNTMDLQFTLDTSAATDGEIVVVAELINGEGTGITMAAA